MHETFISTTLNLWHTHITVWTKVFPPNTRKFEYNAKLLGNKFLFSEISKSTMLLSAQKWCSLWQILTVAVLLYTPILCDSRVAVAVPITAAYCGALTRCLINSASVYKLVFKSLNKTVTVSGICVVFVFMSVCCSYQEEAYIMDLRQVSVCS